MSNVTDSRGNILNAPAPGTNRYAADGLTQDWFKTIDGVKFLARKTAEELKAVAVKAAAEAKVLAAKAEADAKVVAAKIAAEAKAVEQKLVEDAKAALKTVEKVPAEIKEVKAEVNATAPGNTDVPQV